MKIELSAAKAWREAAAENAASDAAMISVEMVTDNIIGRLERGSQVTFQQEVAKIHMDTDDNPATENMLLKQIEGIAGFQGQQAYDLVKNQIAKLK